VRASSAFLLAAVALAAVQSPLLAQPVPSRPDDLRAIAGLRRASNQAIAAHDSGGAVRAMAEDAVIAASGGSLINGRAAMEAAFRASFADPRFVTYLREALRLSVEGDVAMERGAWHGLWTDRQAAGCYLVRWERRNGEWRILREMYVPADPTHCA